MNKLEQIKVPFHASRIGPFGFDQELTMFSQGVFVLGGTIGGHNFGYYSETSLDTSLRDNLNHTLSHNLQDRTPYVEEPQRSFFETISWDDAD